MGECAFCGDSDRAGRTTTECAPSYGGVHEVLGSSERSESPLSQGNHTHTFVRVPKILYQVPINLVEKRSNNRVIERKNGQAQ
jgi:hypothetical protein